MERTPSYVANFVILFALTLGLLTLGMRLPDIQELANSPAKPKPRPRAIIKTQIKSGQDISKKVYIDGSAEALVRNDLVPVDVMVVPSGFRTSIDAPVELIVSSTHSRAPPCHS